MKIIIVGCGKVGLEITRQLADEGHDITVIDHNSHVVEEIANKVDVVAIQGDGANVETLKMANVDKTDLVIAATSRDEANIIACLIAKKCGADRTIARVRNPEYVDTINMIRDELGLSLLINPEKVAAREILRQLSLPSEIKVTRFAKERVELAEIKVGADTPIKGMPLSKISQKYKSDILIGLIKRNEDVIIPKGDTIIYENDKVSIAGQTQEIRKFLRAIGVYKRHPVREVMIIGGGKLLAYLVQPLLDQGKNVKVIEKDRDACLRLLEKFPKANIICGDGTDQELLLNESLDKMDAFIALTDNDEENVIISMYAKSLGVYNVMPKVNRESLDSILEQVGLENTITPKFLTANQIVGYVRAMQNASGSNIEALTEIEHNKVEALEFKIAKNCKFIGKPLKDLNLKEGVLVCFITRNLRVEIANGNSTFELGDYVVVISKQIGLKDVNDVLA